MKNKTDKHLAVAIVLGAAGIFLLFRAKKKATEKKLSGTIGEIPEAIKLQAADYPASPNIFKSSPEPSWQNPTIWENDIYSNPNTNFPEPQTYITPKADVATVEALKAALSPTFLKPDFETRILENPQPVSAEVELNNQPLPEVQPMYVKPALYQEPVNDQPVYDGYQSGGGGGFQETTTYNPDIINQPVQSETFLQAY
jgi:hypothetical protein